MLDSDSNVFHERASIFLLSFAERAWSRVAGHCTAYWSSAPVPRLHKLDKDMHWGTDDEHSQGGDGFKAKAYLRPWGTEETTQATTTGVGLA